MFSTFDLCLLLYVIRLAGWLKHCNLSNVSLSLLFLFLLLRAGFSSEGSRSIASALHSMSFISLECGWSVFCSAILAQTPTTVLPCMLRGPTFRNLAPRM